MYTFFYVFFSLFFTSQLLFVSYKLPLQQLDQTRMSLENLDITLKARPVTIVDELNESLENKRLNENQKKKLEEINTAQEEVIAGYKVCYCSLIKDQIQNKCKKKIIVQTINAYRNIIKNTVFEKTQKLIDELNKNIAETRSKENKPKNLQRENAFILSEKESGKRRARSEDSYQTESDSTEILFALFEKEPETGKYLSQKSNLTEIVTQPDISQISLSSSRILSTNSSRSSSRSSIASNDTTPHNEADKN